MLKNHFRVAFRNILKQKAYNALNAIGLATGIAAGLIIALHIQEELSYEKDFDGYQHIYRVHEDQWAKSSPPMALEMQSFFPRMEAIARFASNGTRVVSTEYNNPGQVTGYYADSSVFSVFKFKIIDGNRDRALAASNTIVVTARMAKRYFGDDSAVGKMLKFDNGKEVPIVAVIEDLPENSHLKFDYLISMPTFYQDVPDDWTSSRGWMVMYTYARFKSDADFRATYAQWPRFIRHFYEGAPDLDKRVANELIRFMPLADIHLKSNMEQEMGANGNILYVYIFIAVELLILVIACANFMSLFTTQTIKRMKEVGMRKIMGAKPAQLMVQIFTEVLLLTFLSLILAIILYQIVLPFYNNISGKTLGVWQIFETDNVLVIGSVLLFVVILSGFYPAFFISRFKAGSFLREDKLPNSMPNRVRSGLVIFQFVVSVSLIAAAIFVQQQMSLIRNKDLGFDKDQVVNISLYGALWSKTFKETSVVKNEFLKNPDILAVGRTGNIIGDHLSVERVVPEGEEREEDKYPTVRVQRIDEDFLNLMNIPLAYGRNFSSEMNDSSSFILNESAVKALGLTDPIGQRVNNTTMKRIGPVVGVVKDYHFTSLHNTIEPLVLEYKPEWTGYLSVKIRAGKTAETLAYVKKSVEAIAPGSLFIYDFLDVRLDALYKSEDSMGRVFQFFSGLAIIIACLGLLGLSAYTVESRTKEIGIRKVLGASVGGIVTMVSSRFFLLVFIGYILAVPVTWYGINQWLQNFAYHITIAWWVFALTGAMIFLIALLVVSFHAITAATRNPVKSLRYE
jgi:putative ABC transport system permease protein